MEERRPDFMLSLQQVLRLSKSPRVAFVGAGGKTTAMCSLAQQLDPPVIVTATTHLGGWQISKFDKVHILESDDSVPQQGSLTAEDGVVLFIGPLVDDNRYRGLADDKMGKLLDLADNMQIPLLIEADGSRMRPLKSPAEHEPPIPDFVDLVVVVAGLSALGKPFSEKYVHRADEFSKLVGIQPGDEITPEAILKVVCHQSGGLKNIPHKARKILLLNQVEPELLQKIRTEIALPALLHYDGVIVASLKPDNLMNDGSPDIDKLHNAEKDEIFSVHEHIAGIILAAGGSRRFGRPKQLLDWHGEPLIRKLAATAIASGLSKVIVVIGANDEEILPVLQDLPLSIVINHEWREGQSASVRMGIKEIGEHINAAIFLLCDQPFTSVELLRALVSEHNNSMASIIAPVVNSQRGNPILFDRKTFHDLLNLEGDKGGRAIFDHFPPHFLQWHDPRILLDIDTPEDYDRLRPL